MSSTSVGGTAAASGHTETSVAPELTEPTESPEPSKPTESPEPTEPPEPTRSVGAGVRNSSQRRVSDTTRVIARIAVRQGGHVTTQQLRAAGVSKDVVTVRVRTGELIRVHRGVYAVGHGSTNDRDRAWAALLAAGSVSALCGPSAAACWSLRRRYPAEVDVITPLRRRIPGVRLQRCGTLVERDLVTHEGLRVTSPARTLLDMAPLITARVLDRYHNELRMRALIDNEQLVDVAVRNRQHRGARKLLELAGASAGEAKRSPLELDWPRFARKYRLPDYEMNVALAGYTVDVLFTSPRLIVELDGWGTHGTRSAYERDRARDATIFARTGVPTVRITHDGFHADPREQAERLHAILRSRASEESPATT